MKEQMKILMLEDVEDDAGLIVRAIKKGGIQFEIKRVDTREEFIDSIRHFHPDVILSDHSLPQFNSIEALKICRRINLPAPFILVTGTVSEEFAVSCLKQGADDYVLKSNLTRLPSAIENALAQRELKQQRVKADVALRTQNEELVKINRELDSFVYSVSHNLRAPLMSVLGLLNIVKKEDEENNNRYVHYFNMMQQSIMKLDDTLKEILDYSRNARNELQLAVVDVKALIEDGFERLKYLEGSDQLRKEVQVTSDCDLVSDAGRLSIILNNLISNAIKYRDENKECYLRIKVSITVTHATIIFEDNGIGISSEFQERVFNMFFRATEKSEGAGLGLYIVKEAIDKLGGTIEMKSTFGQGTQFTMRILNHKGF
ncbi:MAG: hybrid sensor histidine kinase/response regulator [Cyclobacteriaceae bacterium]|nr:hybrid sensor histidine kinase/response regulator [Cyclobacteriaceae bacterium]